ncbi:MAG: D-alanine--D-alanine ligase [Bacteroidales bacterium OttesenSCG-928-I14]|jgi:D-alanine-D-alanine ligase|nr:D-alanine--D-alanine ligase [Bacteroidales bacterium OttesenSCG-928-I14]
MKNIAIICGGYSAEYMISLKSMEKIYSSIDKIKYNPYIVLLTKSKWIVQCKDKTELFIDKNDFSFVYNYEKIKFDFAYITIHGTPGEDGLLQGYLDMLNIPYSCCGLFASSLTFNKYYCNNFLKKIGIKTAKSIFIKKGDQLLFKTIIAKLGLPLFVKPNRGGSSIGVTRVININQLPLAISTAFDNCTEVLIESSIYGIEVTCGCYKTKNKQIIFPITEIISKNDFFDFDAKYNYDKSEEITPARLSKEITNKIQTLTTRIYDYIEAKGIIRVDYIITPEKEIKMLEINTIPGMTERSFIPQQIDAAGLTLKEILTDIIEFT